MQKSTRKKKIFIYCQQPLAEAIDKSIGKNYTTLIGNTISELKPFKPNIVIFDKDVEKVLKACSKKINRFFISSGLVFSGVNEVGFQSKDLPNNTSKEGTLLVNNENIIKQNENHLIMRVSKVIDYNDFDNILKKMKDKEPLDNRKQIYPASPYGIVRVIDTLLSLESKGTIHLRGSERTTEYKIGETLAELLKLEKPESYFVQDGNQVNIKLAGIVLPTVIREILVQYIKDKNVK